MNPDPHAGLAVLSPRLVAFARILVGDGDLAHELVQVSAARALAARRVPAEARAYRAWMFRIVRDAALDALRRRGGAADPGPPPAAGDPWGFDDSRIARITVTQGLAVLAPELREIIALIDVAGFSYAEAAEMTALPVGTVTSRVSRARLALLAAIEASSVRPLSPRSWTPGGHSGGRWPGGRPGGHSDHGH